MEENRKIEKISRKKFLYWLLPIASSATIVFSFKSIYSGLLPNKSSRLITKTSKSERKRKNREKWSKDNLVLNLKTDIVHYPSSKLFTYHNKISDSHLAIIVFAKWQEEVVNPKHFNKSKSGIILEQLALRQLSIPLSPESLQSATDVLATAYSDKYVNTNKYQMNSCNWRLYHLLAQFLALNTSIPLEHKWMKFTDIVKLVNFKLIKIHPKNSWIITEEKFKKRIEYVVKESELYSKRIEHRMKYI